MKFCSNIFFATILFLACSTAKKGEIPTVEPIVVDEKNFFENEVRPANNLPCFAGAYYRKAVSSKDAWVGKKGEVVLPQLNFDEQRKNPVKPGQYLDVSSIYMGGNMDGQETDIGLAWEVIRDEAGQVSKERLAFRPFLRRAAHKSGQQAVYINAPAQKEFYWYPGDRIFMSIKIVEDGKLQFIVEGAGKKYETIFECAGYKRGILGDFKRVNAIDQVGNEGKAAQPTKTSILNAKWLYTTLYRNQGNSVIEVPMHNGRFTSMLCPSRDYFNIVQTEVDKKMGAENISIIGER